MAFLRNKLPGVMKWGKALNSVFCENIMEKCSKVEDLLSKNKQKCSNYSLPCIEHRALTFA